MPTRAARSVSDIVRANVFTRINAILGVLLVIVLSTGSVINGAFGLLIIANSAIGIIQELRAKQTLDKLAIVGQAKPLVRRQSGTTALLPSEVVLDDVIELGPGDQIVVDGDILEETNLEVDESLLTGEADSIAKDAGDKVMSGSFVVAGSGAYRATKVGREAYAAKLAEEASKFTLVKSELRSGINKILQFITYLLLPAGLLIIYTQLFTTDVGLAASRCCAMVGALVPMVPEGLVLMTSIAFAVGVVRLGRRQCLVNELPAIEGLARVDVVCADKTGTLTENGMRVSDLKPLSEAVVGDVLAQLASDDSRPNASMQAIAEAYKMPPGWTATATAPFKSATKWSGASYGEYGNWVIGAPDVLLEPGVPGRRASRADRVAGSAGAAAGLERSARRPRRRPRHRHAGGAGGARAARPSRRPRHAGLLCLPEGLDQGDLRRQCGVGGRGGGLPRTARARRWTPASCPTRPTSWPTRSRSTRRSAGCGRTRSARWCTPCSRAGTRSR